jgi:hypothetical protein
MEAHSAHLKEYSHVIEEAKYRREEVKSRGRRMEEARIMIMDPNETHNKARACWDLTLEIILARSVGNMR